MKSEVYDQTGSLMKRTQELLKEHQETTQILEVYRSTGINFYWLKKFAAGEFKNPSVNRVQFLYEHLTGRRLSV